MFRDLRSDILEEFELHVPCLEEYEARVFAHAVNAKARDNAIQRARRKALGLLASGYTKAEHAARQRARYRAQKVQG